MLRGSFGSFVHDHIFETQNSGTVMIDKIVLHSPFSIIGRMADFLVLGRYMRRFIQSRNARLKAAAESSVWRDYLPIQNPLKPDSPVSPPTPSLSCASSSATTAASGSIRASSSM